MFFCGKCHGQVHKMPCPITNCENKYIQEITQSMEFESSMYELEVHCKYQINGCTEIVTLFNLLGHQRMCDFSSKNLLPKLWVPRTKCEHIKKLEGDVASLKRTVEDLQEKVRINEESSNENAQEKFDQMKKEVLFDVTEQLIRKIDTKSNELESKIHVMIEQKLESHHQEMVKMIADETKEKANELERHLTAVIQEKTVKLNDSHEEQKENVNKLASDYNDYKAKTEEVGMETESLKTTVKRKRQGKRTAKEKLEMIEQIANKTATENLKITTVTWRISGIRAILAKRSINKEIFSKTYVLKEEGIPLKAKLGFGELFASIYVEFLQGSYSSAYFHRRIFFLWDQSGPRRNICRVQEPGFGEKEAESWMKESNGITSFAPLALLEKDDTYVKNDAIVIQIMIEPIHNLSLKNISRNGVLDWKLENYKRVKQDEVDGISGGIWSEPFYSSKAGYRMKIVLFMSKSNFGVCLAFVSGEFDAKLPAEFINTTTVRIIDQSSSTEKNHLTKTMLIKKTIILQPIGVFPYAKIEHPNYLKDDCLVIRAMVKANPILPSENNP